MLSRTINNIAGSFMAELRVKGPANSGARNVAWNLSEVITSGLVLFLLYKVIALTVGLSGLGVWSLVIATTSIARIADVGASGGLGRYVAISRARGQDSERALIYVESAMITSAIFYAIICILLYFPAELSLALVTKGATLAQARQLLPYSMISFLITSVNGVLGSALMGFQRSDLRSKVTLAGMFIQVLLAIMLIRLLGLRGLAIAQICQGLFGICGCWMLCVHQCRGSYRLILPHRLAREPLKELMGFGLKLQGLNIATFLYEPTFKFVLSAYGGLASLGMYEMASRLVQQVRQLIIAPSLNLTPIFSTISETDPASLETAVGDATAAISFAGICLMGCIVAASPVVALFWLGRINVSFVEFVALIATGWLVNIVGVSGYILGIATGNIRWNVFGALITTVGGPGLGLVLGRFWGPLGIVGAAMLGVAVGAFVTQYNNCRILNVRLLPTSLSFRKLPQIISQHLNITPSTFMQILGVRRR